MKLGERMKKMRKRLGLTQKEFAQRITGKVDYTYIGKIEISRWNRRYTSIIQLRESSIPWVLVLTNFSEAIPQRAWLRELFFGTSPTETNQKKNSSILVIKGSMKWEKLVANLSLMEFISQLEKSPYLNDVYLQSTERNTRYGHEVIDFTIAAHLPRKEGISSSSTQGSTERIERSGS